jgi:ketosteroid isomerase-like protein
MRQGLGSGRSETGISKGEAMDRTDFERWVKGYEKAWASNDRADIMALFTEDATYRFRPEDEPLRGSETIADTWIQNKDEPGDYTWRFKDVLGVEGDVGFVYGETDYHTDPPRTYSNLWVIRLTDDGRASDFTEWFMKHR